MITPIKATYVYDHASEFFLQEAMWVWFPSITSFCLGTGVKNAMQWILHDCCGRCVEVYLLFVVQNTISNLAVLAAQA